MLSLSCTRHSSASNMAIASLNLNIAMLKSCGYSKFGVTGGQASASSVGILYQVDSGSTVSMTSGTMYTIPDGTTLNIQIRVTASSSSASASYSNNVLLFG